MVRLAADVARHLRRNGWCVGRHRVRRLMAKMGFGADLPAPEDPVSHIRSTRPIRICFAT